MKLDHYTGEIYHHGRWHKPVCSTFAEPDEDMGAYPCDCDREDEEEPSLPTPDDDDQG